jgi:hypothetical protein
VKPYKLKPNANIVRAIDADTFDALAIKRATGNEEFVFRKEDGREEMILG